MSGLSGTLLTVQRGRNTDLALAALAIGLAVTGTVFEVLESTRSVPPLAGGVALATLTGLVVVGQRRPGTAAVAVLVLSLLYHLLGFPGLAPAVVLFVVIYAVTARGNGARSLAISAACILAMSAVPLLPPQPVDLSWSIIGPAVGFVAVAALGEAARARRVAVEEQLRAVHLAAEQEAQRRLMQDRIDLAREVHDLLAHTITIVAVHAAAAEEAIGDRPEEARTALAAVRGAAREAMAELRATLNVLHNPAVAHPSTTPPQRGLPELAGLREQAANAGVAVALTITGEATLPTVVEHTIYRIVQEALTNTLRHADARTATVTIDLRADDVAIEIVDDGAAAEPADPDQDGRGVTGMRERAHALGGTLDAGPATGHGFRIAARLPVGTNR
ncbi:MAG TPA: histidine kinase [Pseudonocardia sp.]